MCTSPLHAFDTGQKTKDGNVKYLIKSYKVDYLFDLKNKWTPHYLNQPHPRYDCEVIDDYIQIPCGRCLECRLARSKEWAYRCILESKEHEHNYFVTLTYADPPKSSYIDDNGEIRESFTLVKADVQKFIKRVRKHFTGHKIRYYMCGEYGSLKNTHRPHYHIIFFGLPLDDLKLAPPYLQQNKHERNNKYDLYVSDYLTNEWKHGHVVIGPVTIDTCAYTARYIMKKQLGDNTIYDYMNILPPYTAMSNRPGIASNYFHENVEKIYQLGNYFINGEKVYPPRYYKNILKNYDEDKYEKFNNERMEAMEDISKHMLDHTDLSIINYFDVLEDIVENKNKSLTRNAL